MTNIREDRVPALPPNLPLFADYATAGAVTGLGETTLRKIARRYGESAGLTHFGGAVRWDLPQFYRWKHDMGGNIPLV